MRGVCACPLYKTYEHRSAIANAVATLINANARFPGAACTLPQTRTCGRAPLVPRRADPAGGEPRAWLRRGRSRFPRRPLAHYARNVRASSPRRPSACERHQVCACVLVLIYINKLTQTLTMALPCVHARSKWARLEPVHGLVCCAFGLDFSCGFRQVADV